MLNGRRYYLLLFMLIHISYTVAEDRDRISGELALSPNSMGTLGEGLIINYDPLPHLRLTLGGQHKKLEQLDLSYEAFGGPLEGDLHREIWAGEISAGPMLSGRNWLLNLFLAYGINQENKSSRARIIEKAQVGDDPYPQDTFGFVDTQESEFPQEFLLGFRSSMELSTFKINIKAIYSPFLISTEEGGFFQTIPSTTTSPSSTPFYMWRENEYNLEAQGSSLHLFVNIGKDIKGISTHLSVFADFQTKYLMGSTEVSNLLYTAQTDSLANLNIYETSNLYSADISSLDYTFEGGLSIYLPKLPGKPIIDLSYVRIISTKTFDYPSDGLKEQWIEDYDYINLTMKWGL
ncbi:MAG: hypothetical protein PF447_01725 [Spirochaetaceae bacterium]|jgi:hypothetical protein|nr:hypothetical protein [Spirochaetaceae bacterium]